VGLDEFRISLAADKSPCEAKMALSFLPSSGIASKSERLRFSRSFENAATASVLKFSGLCGASEISRTDAGIEGG
jgi:hypothetical protein